MNKAFDATETCPFHKAWELGRGSRLLRLVALGNAAALRTVRDVIDRRLASLERAARSESPRSVRIPITQEPLPHD